MNDIIRTLLRLKIPGQFLRFSKWIVSRERKSKKNKELGLISRKELGLISRTGKRRCGYGLKLREPNPNLSNLVLYYKKMKDMDTMKPLTNTQISKLLLREYNLSVSDESVGKILEDIERDTWNLH